MVRMETPRILILEDDVSLGETLCERMQKQGYALKWAKSCAEAIDFFSKDFFNLLILDLSLPDGSGFDVADKVLSQSQVPIVFMTALNTAENRLKGYEMGAVEFVPKPFHFKELLLRIEHVFENHIQEGVIDYKLFKLNVSKMSFFLKEAQKEKFPTTRDFKIFHYMLTQSPRVISRDEILTKFWGEDKFPSNRTVDNSILRLRDLLGKKISQHIRSVRGVGYQWVDEHR